LNVKKVGGKFRYFFEVRNRASEPFEEEIEIRLKKANGDSVWDETFRTGRSAIIHPNVGKVVYTDAYTCPASAHGESGITNFQFEVKSVGRSGKVGRGQIQQQIRN